MHSPGRPWAPLQLFCCQTLYRAWLPHSLPEEWTPPAFFCGQAAAPCLQLHHTLSAYLPALQPGDESALDRFTSDLTQSARMGKLDPVIGASAAAFGVPPLCIVQRAGVEAEDRS